jgi:type I restriction enzyme S subunit
MSTNELPEGWIHTKLGKVVDYGKATKCNLEDVQPDTWVLELEDIEKGTSKLIQRIEASNRPFKSTKNVFNTGDVLYGKLRPYLNKVLVAETDGVCTTEIVPIDAEPFVNNRYLFYWFRGGQFLNYVEAVSYGVNMPRLGTKEGIDAPLVLAPIAEQKVIVDKLDNLLSQVESIKIRLERIPEILKQFRQSVLAAAVSGKLTEEWRESNEIKLTILDYQDAVKNFKLKAKGLSKPEELKTWLSCQIGHVFNVRSGDGLTAKEMMPEGNVPVYGGNGITGYHNQSNIQESEIVIGRVGFYCGSVHLTEEIAWVTDNALIVDYPEQLVLPEFVYWLLLATNLREDSASSAQPVISGSKIYPINILLPPLDEQVEIAQRVERLFRVANFFENQIQLALDRVDNLTQSILAKAFRGELTAEWREANPELISGENSAEALLERIKAERSAKSVTKRGRGKA